MSEGAETMDDSLPKKPKGIDEEYVVEIANTVLLKIKEFILRWMFVHILVIVTGISGGTALYWKNEADKKDIAMRLSTLEKKEEVRASHEKEGMQGDLEEARWKGGMDSRLGDIESTLREIKEKLP